MLNAHHAQRLRNPRIKFKKNRKEKKIPSKLRIIIFIAIIEFVIPFLFFL